MSNPSLKDQLQALSLGLSSTPEAKSSAPQKPKQPNVSAKNPQPSGKSGKQKPAWLEQAQYGVELLKAHFPNCFKELKEIQPLKIGIKQDLVKHLSTREDIVISDKACMVTSLTYYVNSMAYHKNMVAGANRIDLEGNPTSVVTAEEAQYSADCHKAKSEKKHAGNANMKRKASREVTV